MTLDVHQHPARRRLTNRRAKPVGSGGKLLVPLFALSLRSCWPVLIRSSTTWGSVLRRVPSHLAETQQGWGGFAGTNLQNKICKSLNSFTVWKEISRGFKYLNYHLCGQKVNVSYLIRVSDTGGEVNWEDKKEFSFYT